MNTIVLISLLHFLTFLPILTQSSPTKHHIIRFRSPALYPEGLAYDPLAEHFLVGGLHQPALLSVSDAGVVEIIIHDVGLPVNSSFLGIAVDKPRRRILVVVQSIPPRPPYSALAAYDLKSRRRMFLVQLPYQPGFPAIANAVAVDHAGNAFVTNSKGNYIWRVSKDGDEAFVWSSSPLFSRYPADDSAAYRFCGLNGIAYVNLGYMLVVQSNTGKLFKVDGDDGSAREVLLNKNLGGADGVALRNDGVLLVVSTKKVWFIRSTDSWAEGTVYDETPLDEKGFATSVAIGGDRRAYVVYGRTDEGMSLVGDGGGAGGGSAVREWFEIEEVRSSMEGEDEKLWIYIVVGLGLAYFMFWRFQMNRLVKNLDKKID